MPKAWSHRRAGGAARFQVSHLGASPVASLPPLEGCGQVERQHVLPVLPSPASSSAGKNIKATTCRKDLLGKPELRPRRASSQNTSQVQVVIFFPSTPLSLKVNKMPRTIESYNHFSWKIKIIKSKHNITLALNHFPKNLV